MKGTDKKLEAKLLRQKAEHIFKKKQPKSIPNLSEPEMLKLIHELEVHQIELALQNEELMHAKAITQESLQKYTEYYDFAPSGYFTLSREGIILAANFRASQMLDKKRLDLIKSRFLFIVSDHCKEKFNLFLDGVFTSNKKEECEITLFHRSGPLSDVYLTGVVCDNGEECLITMVDITERKQTEVLLQEYKTRLEATMFATNIAWWEMNVITGSMQFNHRKAEMLDYSPEQFTHYIDFMNLVHPDDYNLTMQAMRDHFEGRKDLYESDYRIKTKSGDYKWFHDKGFITKRDENGQPMLVCGIVVDITEKKESELELEDYRNKLEDLVKERTLELGIANELLMKEMENEKEVELTLEKSLKKEKELNEMKSRFISTTSHEFRTPLTAILSSSELLKKYAVNWSEDKKAEHFERIKHSIQYLVRLLDDILTISRTETGEISYNPEQIDLVVFAEECVESSKSLLMENHSLKLNYLSRRKKFILDKKLMSFIFNNLLSNAAKYSPKGGTIGLTISTRDKILSIELSDEGIGIPPEETGNIFNPFYRTKNVENISGNGLGLAIVKSAVELHKGEITVKSELGKGTTFKVKIPVETKR
jgi:PAS domain S-box-containing protein